LAGKPYCAACRERGDVDYTEQLRQKYWGKRDGYVWLIGIFGTIAAIVRIAFEGRAFFWTQRETLLPLLISLFAGVVYVAYLLLRPWARLGLFGLLAGNLIAISILSEQGQFSQQVATLLLPFLVYTSAFNSTQNKLAFKLPVSREALEKMYRVYFDNRIARTGFLLSLISLFVPGLFILSFVLCMLGLRRVDPKSVPPIGRKKTAIAGIVLSVLGFLMSLAIMANIFFVSRGVGI